MKIPPFEIPLAEIRADLDAIRRPLRIAIIRSQNGFNIGSIIRTAHSFLVREIILVGDEPFYQRAAMGMQRYENLVYLPDEAALIAWAAERNVPLVSFEREPATVSLWKADLPLDCVLVFGSETAGIPPEVCAASAQVVAIPMAGINNSYPITVAAGIAMAEWTRRYFGD